MTGAGEKLGESPSRLPAADLGTAFGPPDRSAGLGGRLQKPPSPEPSPTPISVAPQARPDPQEATAQDGASVPTQRAGRPRVKRTSNVESIMPVQVIVYLPVSLKDRLRDAARTSDTTYTAIALDAIDATHAELGELLGASRPADAPRREGSLFGVQPVGQAHQDREARVQVSLRTRRRDVDVIDELAARHGISRSALISAALAAHLRAG